MRQKDGRPLALELLVPAGDPVRHNAAVRKHARTPFVMAWAVFRGLVLGLARMVGVSRAR